MIRRLEFGDFWVNDFTIEGLNELIENSINQNSKIVLAHHNLHSLFLSLRNKQLLEFYNEVDYIHADGMPIIWINKVLGIDMYRENRITFMDWIHKLLELANNRHWRVYYLGSKDWIIEKLVQRIKNEYPDLKFNARNGYFDISGQEGDTVLNEIRDYRPNLLFVGMGMPRQELWIKKSFEEIGVNAFLPCGACFDYLAGASRIPPRWIGKIGLEWLYRFLCEPIRLFKRYFFEPIFLIPYFLKILLHKNKKR